MATPQSIRYLNELRAMNVLFRRGGMSRAALARELGLNRSSTGNIIANLVSDQLVQERAELERPQTRTGRPGIVVELNAGGSLFLGAEIGVDRLGVVAVDLAARQTYREGRAFATAQCPAAQTIETVLALIEAAIAQLGGSTRIGGLCVALPALLDRDGMVINGLLLGWRHVPLRALLRARFGEGFPIAIENDANAFGIAETYQTPLSHTATDQTPAPQTSCERAQTMAFLLIENGVGGGIVAGGTLFRGAFGHAAEFGQIVLGGQGFYSGRTRPGHLEGYVGKDAIVTRYRQHGADPAACFEDVVAALERGEPRARRTAQDWGRKLALGLTQITSVLNPAAIVLGGSVAPVFRFVAQEVSAAMRREFLQGFRMPDIRVSNLGADGPALGAALLMHQKMFSVDEKILHHGEPATIA